MLVGDVKPSAGFAIGLGAVARVSSAVSDMDDGGRLSHVQVPIVRIVTRGRFLVVILADICELYREQPG